jgi:MOSC domain-containing protein YiiM
VHIDHAYISAGHRYFGRYGKEPLEHPMVEVPVVTCVAGMGIEGDRFYGYRDGYRGQVTFFSMECYRDLCGALGVSGKPPSVFRRNLVVSGVDLNGLIGRRFRIQGSVFEGMEECRPCAWMNLAFAEGAEERMKGRGGLRARVLVGGLVASGRDAELAVEEALEPVRAARVSGFGTIPSASGFAR